MCGADNEPMELQPFVRVDETPFSITLSATLAARGEPLTRRFLPDVQLEELDYGEVVFRFQASGRLEEITKLSPVVIIRAQAIVFPLLGDYVRENDPRCFERAGFLISPRFGIAFDPQCPSWVTALAGHCLDAWRAI
jgi:hypothetical protein